METELLSLLKEALERMKDESDNMEADLFGLACGNCIAGVPMAHSLGCRIENAILKAEKRLSRETAIETAERLAEERAAAGEWEADARNDEARDRAGEVES